MKELTHDLLIRFFEEHHPEKLKYNPKIVEIVGSNVVFKMDDHEGNFCTNIVHFSEKNNRNRLDRIIDVPLQSVETI